ncbi:MAG: hypothetical protein NTZ59_14850, partial [Bacteroidetes bacterium]|nr:hypothetical protein [Bacteroidota bacterium]
RVLKRGVEEFVLNEIIEIAKANHYKLVVGEYLPTPKNEIVKEHYQNLGFTANENGLWHLDIETLQLKNTFINKLNNSYV